jgi:hypothetical protein
MKPDRANDSISLVEEVPGVEEHSRWYIWEHRPRGEGRGKLWSGPTKSEGIAWAAEHGEIIDFVEHFEP